MFSELAIYTGHARVAFAPSILPLLTTIVTGRFSQLNHEEEQRNLAQFEEERLEGIRPVTETTQKKYQRCMNHWKKYVFRPFYHSLIMY